MQQPITVKSFLYKHVYLLVIAAWLITISFIIDNYWSGNASVESVHKRLEKYIGEQEKDFSGIIKSDTALTNNLVSGKYTTNQLGEIINKDYFLFCYTTNDFGYSSLSFWSTQVVLPSTEIIESTDSCGFILLQNGYYVWNKHTEANHFIIALIPVKWNYFVKNEYLKNTFAIGDKIENSYDLDLSRGDINVHATNGKSLFFLKKKLQNIEYTNNLPSVYLRILATFFILFFVHLLAVFIYKKSNLLYALTFLAALLFLLRYISYRIPIPMNLRQFELFDPSIYSTNYINKSLGDLFVNSLLLVWVSLFLRIYIKHNQFNTKPVKSAGKWTILIGCGLAFLALSFGFGMVIKSMISDSQLSFDVINFFTLNIYSAIGFAVFCLISIAFFALSQTLVYIVKSVSPNSTVPFFLIITITGLAYLTFKMNFTTSLFELAVLIWALLLLLLLTNRKLNQLVASISSSRLIFWLFFFSLSITVLIVMENNKKELNKRKHYAEALANKADQASEILMNIMLTDFKNPFLSKNFEKFKSAESNLLLKDSLVNGNFSGYTNKYDTKIYTFNANEEPLFNNDSTSSNDLNTVLNTQAKPTNIEDLFYYDVAFDRYGYISKKVVRDTSDNILGYLFILANPRKSKPEALYPELFSKGRNSSIESSSLYSFAVYSNGQLVKNHNDYPFATKIPDEDIPKNDFIHIDKKGYDELWYKAGPQKIVVIAKQDNLYIEGITLFSYLFCSFLLLTALFWLINGFTKLTWKNRRKWQLLNFSIRNQIHGTIIFISVFSFLIIGVATILFFIKRYENNNRERLSRTINVMANELKTSLNELAIFDDVIKIYDEGYVKKLEQTIEKVAEIHAADINLYDLDGNLRASSLPLPYSKGLVSKKMAPSAFFHLNKLKEIQYFTNEKIGDLHFASNYIPVLDEMGREYAYLNIPYFTSQSELKKEISNFLVAIINLNAFIFLIAGIVALFITNRITRSFSFISEKMKQVNLGKANAAIIWDRKDEIGALVSEYNKMVSKLDESAASLAKSEREGAWREMARQVAHEIKNPLTPMKLSLQYLQKAIQGNADNVKVLTASVAQTLVEQIDHLNQIAGEFSQFANIGHTRSEVFELNDVLKTVVQLHAMQERVDIEYKPLPVNLKIEADKTQINRLFTNLILNAVQSIPDEKTAEIKVGGEIIGNHIQIYISDNGSGIATEMQHKLFTPNFTTKSSGTGLGLAICKGIVEQAKGKIWFSTKENIGTIFYVEFPIIYD